MLEIIVRLNHLALQAPEFLNQIQQGNSFDLILCDINLEEETGLEIYKKTISSAANLKDKFIFLTGDSFNSDLQLQVKETGCPTYLQAISTRGTKTTSAQTVKGKIGQPYGTSKYTTLPQ